MLKRSTHSMLFYLMLAAITIPFVFVVGTFAAPLNTTKSAVNNPAEAQRAQAHKLDQLTMLRNENARLKALIKNLSQRMQEMQSDKPFCSNVATSSNKEGRSRDCTPYACDLESGSCHFTAASSEDCAPGFLWDGGNQCVAIPPSSPN